MPEIGHTQINKKDGRIRVWDGTQYVAQAPPKGATGDAALRGRLAMGMGQMVQAQENMRAAETGPNGERVNPLNRDWGAALIDAIPDFDILAPLAQKIGGQDYQDYVTASKQYEAQIMPIMSGAAVSPSEAKRQVQATLPALGNTGQTLTSKERARQMQLNGAAKAAGLPMPYPSVPTYGANSRSVPAPQTKQQQQIVKPRANKGYRVISVE